MSKRFINSNFRAPGNTELSTETLRQYAPSIFAGGAMDGASDRYTFLPTAEIVEGLRGSGWAPVNVAEQRVRKDERRGFQKHMVRFQLRDSMSVNGRGAEFVPELLLLNSHDRTSGYQLHAGLFRFVCCNGIVVADATFERVSIPHINLNPADVIQASYKIADSVPLIVSKVDEFRAHRLSQIEARAFAESAILLKYDDLETAPIGAETLLSGQRNADEGADLWHTFNRVQENLTHGGQKEYGRRVPAGESTFKTRRAPRTRGVEGIDSNVKLNKALWHLAEVLKAGGQPSDAADFHKFAVNGN